MGKNIATYTYDTFSDLRLTTGDSGSSVTVLGASTINDGDGGRFYYDPIATALDDGLNIIKPTPVSGAGRWVRTTPLITKTDVGLSNVDNTSDVDKPVSTAQATAIANAILTANGYTDDQVAAITGAEFGGSIMPSTPLSPTGKIFYFALQPGTYPNAGSVVVNDASFAVISYDGVSSWSISQTEIIDYDLFLKKDQVTNIINVGNVPDLTYNLGPQTGVSTRILNFPISPGQVITKITMNGSKAGGMPIKLFRRNAGDSFTFVKSIDLPVTVGVASYDTSIEVDEVLYPGFFMNGSGEGGQVKYKTSTQDSYSFPSTNVMGTETFTLVTSQLYAIEFEVSTIEYGDLKPITDRLDKIEPHFVGNILDPVSSDMTGTGNWLVGIGTPVMDISSGTMKVTFTSGNQGVYLPELVPGTAYSIELKIRKNSGNIKRVSVGQFSSTPSTGWISVPISTNWQTVKFDIVAANTDLYIGALTSSNLGGTVEVDYIRAVVTTGLDYQIENESILATKLGASNATNFNAASVWASISKTEKALTQIGVLSDSIMANGTPGDNIPNPEPTTQRPIRLGYSNTISRRIYDLLSWNKPQWRRLDDAAWTKSGTWTPINTTAIFEPTYSNETYHNTTTSGAYVEITVPSGMENFAVVVREGLSSAVANFTLNGSPMPSGNGVSSYDTLLPTAATNGTGNPYKVIHFHNLPTGANVIRITKDSTANALYIWGGFYWTGNTLVVMNVSHGGHTMDELIDQHVNDEVVRNNFDAILFQVTEMNEMGAANPRQTEAALRYILGDLLKDKDALITTPYPFGKNPANPSINYYDMYKVPLTMKQLNLLVKEVAYEYGHPFLDIFTIFERRTINRGGTLENGDSGLFYTVDGQHQNPYGMAQNWQPFLSVIKQISLYNS